MTFEGNLAPEFWPLAGRVMAAVGGGALLTLLMRGLPRHPAGGDAANAGRASLWPRFWVWCAIAIGMILIGGVGGVVFALGMATIAVLAYRELFSALQRGASPVASGTVTSSCIALVWVGLPLTLLVLLRNRPDGFGIVAWVIIVVPLSDVLAMFGGLLVGRTPLMISMSPGKTLEGLVSGFIGGILGALLVRFTLPDVALAPYLIASLALCVAGVTGDFAASAVKRRAGLKDFSSILPGHGGVMDRLDSILAAAPVAYLIVWLGILQ